MAYKFNDHSLKIEIEDLVFFVSMSQDMGMKLNECKEKYNSLIKKSGNDLTSKCCAVDELLDAILGEDAAAEIFHDREDNIFERISVLQYVLEEITAYAHRLRNQVNNNAFYGKNKGHNGKRRKGSH